ncbi:hypothetical protein JHN55_22760 [Streptomyces sp. MBT56]|uniref:hypothetical protein n=1 Tax=unclassified Streptomyces TaxID=2593676 RepID=UPI00190C85C9|nr:MULTISPECIES: hypothetical protein [unclassified Streptomyces]MBK3559293.1 hypothetical protein [Streptomyces sp. MBT56]MBK3601016.1 hypothetical protein [Streptomyces sp. MBT54]MBK3613922.1 hypothetical protein [Streptomyces sp. MBT98]MBK6042013.1 hypothetical protein [Streptomyces sp. MBT55]
MIRLIIDNPNAYYPKFPRVIEGQTEEDVERQVKRCLSGMKGKYGAQYARTTVTRIRGTEDETARYLGGTGE